MPLATESRISTRSSTASTLCVAIAAACSHHLRCTEKQTVAFNIQARVDFKSKKRARMSVWEAMEMLNTLVDESDPDVGLSTVFRQATNPFILL